MLKYIFLRQNRKRRIFSLISQKHIFAKKTKPQKLIFPPESQNTFPAKTEKMHFLAKTAKRTFSAKTHFPLKPQKHILRKIAKTYFSAKTAKTHFLPRPKNTIFRQNRKMYVKSCFSSRPQNHIFSPKPKNLFSRKNPQIMFYSKTAKLYIPPKPYFKITIFN